MAAPAGLTMRGLQEVISVYPRHCRERFHWHRLAERTKADEGMEGFMVITELIVPELLHESGIEKPATVTTGGRVVLQDREPAGKDIMRWCDRLVAKNRRAIERRRYTGWPPSLGEAVTRPIKGMSEEGKFRVGLWVARDAGFFERPLVALLGRLRIVPATVVVVIGILPPARFLFTTYPHLKAREIGDGGSVRDRLGIELRSPASSKAPARRALTSGTGFSIIHGGILRPSEACAGELRHGR